ncbi:MAG: sigma-70 family RNA polymerase sigma factor [Anaerolineae bacterium]
MSAPMTLAPRLTSIIPVRRRSTAKIDADSDQALLAQIVKQKPEALSKLYDRYASRALGLAFRILKDRDLAEQVIQDAFWKVWQNAAKFEPTRGSFSTWFFTIVRNLSIDQLRRRRDEPSLDDDQQAPAIEAQMSAPDVGEAVGRQLRSEEIRSALRGLPPAQQRVLEMAYFEGLTRREIADKLDEPLGTIHTRARLGLEKLGQLLDVSWS